jgi:hypothetical protein
MMAFGLMLGFFDYRLEKVQFKFKRQGFSCESVRRALLVKPIKHGRERSGQRLRPMLLTIAVAVGSIVSLVIAFFLTDGSHWRKFLLVVGILGIASSSLQAYKSRRRADHLQNEVAMLQQRQEYWDVSKLNAVGLTGIARFPLAEHSPINDLVAPHIKLEPHFSVDCLPEAMTAFGTAIEMNDKFPFPYYYRALCNYANHRHVCQQDLEKAQFILSITTTIPGHNQNHDEVLKFIQADGANPPDTAQKLKKEGKVLPKIFLAGLEGDVAASFAQV